MRVVLALLFLVACGAVVVIKTGDVFVAWTAWNAPQQISFEQSDTKLFLVWAVIGAAVVSWFVWPESFSPQPRVSWQQGATLGITISGLLAGFMVVTGGDYLAAAERHAAANGYVRCSSDTDLMLGELTMARDTSLCPQEA